MFGRANRNAARPRASLLLMLTTEPKVEGHAATSPWKMSRGAWKQIASRTWRRTWLDNVGLVAAGVAFYGFLAIVPLLGIIVLAYGLAADPQTTISNINSLTRFLPPEVAGFINDQIVAAVKSSAAIKGTGVLFALTLALYGGANGAGALMTALNIAYHEEEKRSLSRFYITALAITCGAMVIAVTALGATAVISSLEQFVPRASVAAVVLGKLMAYSVLLIIAAALAATLYRIAPSREKARWEWITPGSLFSAASWLALTVLFGFYLTSVADYEASYGSLSAVIALLTWMYLSAYVLVIGGELNSEVEHQTVIDSTTGTPKPIGERGAWAADNVVHESDPEKQVAQTGDAPSLEAAGPPLPAQEQ